MKYLKYFFFALVLALTVWSCSDSSNSTGPDPGPDPGPNPTEASAEKQFVYNAMNEWYYWQSDVADLADDRFSSDEAFQQFLMGYSNEEALFEDLQFIDDDFSFFIDDYQEYRSNRDGIFAALGFNDEYFLLSDNFTIVGYVGYVVPGSPAENAGLERGDLYTEVDGTGLNIDNFQGLLSGNTAKELTLAEVEETSDGATITETGETVTVQQEQVAENPIFRTAVIDTNGTKIGYLMYNAFRGNSHSDLNSEFANFQSQGIQELVLDLRYNSGGAVITSQLLASLISGESTSNIFAKLKYNEKQSNNNDTDFFLDVVPLQDEDGNFLVNNNGEFINTEPMNNLSSLNRLYVLTGINTASASEALVNGLKPFMDVILVGQQTVGKDEGSLTFVNSPSTNYLEPDNPADRDEFEIGIQPIVAKIVNSLDEDYPMGFEPDFPQSEITTANLIDMAPLGSPEDPLLGRAISQIVGEPMAQKPSVAPSSVLRGIKLMKHSDNRDLVRSGLYIEPFMMPTSKDN